MPLNQDYITHRASVIVGELQAILAQLWLRTERKEGVTLYRCGVPHPQPNGVMRIAGHDIRRQVDYAREALNDLLSVWWLGPDSHPRGH